eukprot:118334-Ditylum_brightwellii.AAC.1
MSDDKDLFETAKSNASVANDAAKTREVPASVHIIPQDGVVALSWNDAVDVFEVGDSAEFRDDNGTKIQGYDTIDGVIQYIVAEDDGPPFDTTADNLRKREVPDVGVIPVSSKDYAKVSKELTAEECSHISKPATLDALQQEYLSWHH